MILKISILGILVCVMSVFLKNWLKEAVLPLQLTFAIVAIAAIFKAFQNMVDGMLGYISDSEFGSAVFSVLLKGAVICIVAKLSSDAAKDSGNGLVADIIDLIGRIMLISLGLPFIENVINTAISFLP